MEPEVYKNIDVAIEELQTIFNSKILKSKSKGIDRVSHFDFARKKTEEFQIIKRKLENKTYKFSPYLEKLNVKNRDKNPRLISIPTVRDRIVITLLKKELQQAFPDHTKKKITSKYIHEIESILKVKSFSYFIKADIECFYDNINHSKLKEFIGNNILPHWHELIDKLLINPTCPKDYKKREVENYIPTKGVPQGVSISNILAEVYLTEFDKFFTANKSIYYFRYVDDILIFSDDKEYLNILTNKLEEIGLKLNSEKSKFDLIENGIKYLGFEIYKDRISIQDSRIQRFLKKIFDKITWFKKCYTYLEERPTWLTDDESLTSYFIEEVNSIITGTISGNRGYGWLFHYKDANDLEQFYRIDNIFHSNISKISIFKNIKTTKFKSVARAYFEIKHNPLNSNYISNIDKIDTFSKRRAWLIRRGIVKENEQVSDERINRIFEFHKDKFLKNLERDEKELGNDY